MYPFSMKIKMAKKQILMAKSYMPYLFSSMILSSCYCHKNKSQLSFGMNFDLYGIFKSLKTLAFVWSFHAHNKLTGMVP